MNCSETNRRLLRLSVIGYRLNKYTNATTLQKMYCNMPEYKNRLQYKIISFTASVNSHLDKSKVRMQNNLRTRSVCKMSYHFSEVPMQGMNSTLKNSYNYFNLELMKNYTSLAVFSTSTSFAT